ncbi:hypothetical protein [Kineococcus sp. SYSU DK005]
MFEQSIRNGLREPGAIPLLVVVCLVAVVGSLVVKYFLDRRKK